MRNAFLIRLLRVAARLVYNVRRNHSRKASLQVSTHVVSCVRLRGDLGF
jgi:hypothetical protein